MRTISQSFTIGLLQERALGESHALANHLQTALNSRVVLELAKGVVAEAAAVEMGEAFHLLRNYGRNRNRRLTDVAHDVIRRRIPILDPAAPAPPRAGRH